MHFSSSMFNVTVEFEGSVNDIENDYTIALYCHSQGSFAELSTIRLTLAKLPYVGKAPLNALEETSNAYVHP